MVSRDQIQSELSKVSNPHSMNQTERRGLRDLCQLHGKQPEPGLFYAAQTVLSLPYSNHHPQPTLQQNRKRQGHRGMTGASVGVRVRGCLEEIPGEAVTLCSSSLAH